MKRRFPRSRSRSARRTTKPAAGFTVAELMVAMAIGSLVVAAALAGIVSLQRSYAATEQYAGNLADQSRLLDCLGMDLRRARAVAFDADGQGMMLTLPDFYTYGAGDPQRTAPLPITPQIPEDLTRAVYTNATGAAVNDYNNLPAPAVYYHFDATAKTVTREELPRALPADRRPTNLAPLTNQSTYGVRTLASSLQGFPLIQLQDDAGAALGAPNTTPAAGQTPAQASITVCFKPTFATVSTPDTNLIRLYGQVFLRNHDLGSN